MKKSLLTNALIAVSFLLASPALADHWQSTENILVRTPSGSTPENPITLSTEINDTSACGTELFQFWFFDENWNSIGAFGTPTSISGGVLSQTADLPSGFGIPKVRIACVDSEGNRIDTGPALEEGTPAFTPTGTSTMSSVAWDAPEYTRSPSGSMPQNPITLDATFADGAGCDARRFRFWIFDDEGNPIEPIGNPDIPVSVNWGITQTITLPVDVAIENIRVACTDAEGNYVSSSADLETSSFTPIYPILFTRGGGTGVDSFTSNGVLIGNGTNPLNVTEAGSAYQVLRVPSGGGAPTFGSLDLAQSASVTGTLPVLFGGTGVATAFTQGSLIFAGASGVYSQNNSALSWDNAASKLTVVGTIAATHVKGLGSTPSISAGSGAGTGGTVSIVGSDLAGEITVTAGLLPAGGATIATVTFNSAYSVRPFVTFSPTNPTAGLLSGLTGVHVTSTSSTFQFISGTTGIGAGTFKWSYHVIE